MSLEKKSNKEIVKEAITAVFVNGDLNAIDKYYSEDYIQHNPKASNGRDELKQIFSAVKLKYEIGLIAENGEFVMVHARMTVFGRKPMVVVDIFRVKGGKLAEHWDVQQEEVPAENTRSKNAMFPAN